ncbi:glycosyltransferase family 4 protein [Pseudomonas fluorescens]|uniref:glycosyltransferase family 4 protein n=1 Tax=Pseudomonas fluorescens TaxID=294 RepID=UPI001249A81A|nr:glycosyltransferase family 4 protein [Pseudomonas fluorescens]CAG8864742.1 D-inositol-3-phosphate glycosyltransferase [Pseudomonas fluorescens]
MKQRKIIFFHLFNDRSGSPKVLSQIVKVASRNNNKTEVVTSDHSNGFLSGLGDTQSQLFYRRSENKLITLLYYVYSQVALFVQCLKYSGSDTAFYINTMMPFGAAVAGKIKRIPVYYHVHETSIKPKPLKIFLRWVIQVAAKKVIYVSKYLEQVESFSGLKYEVVHNGLDCIPVVRSKEIVDEFQVLMVCSLKKYKGVLEFVEIAHLSSEDKQLKFTLVLNATAEEIDKFFEKIDLPTNLTMHSRQKNLEKFYERSHLLLNLSKPNGWIETFGLTILEGMSFGLPVIVPPVGGPTEIIRDGIEGYLIDSESTSLIRDAIYSFSRSPGHYQEFSRRALKRSSEFSLEKFESKIVKLLNEIAYKS